MTDPTAVEQVSEHASEAYDPGVSILHHILDSHEIEIPFTQLKIHLPTLHLPAGSAGSTSRSPSTSS